MTRIEELVLQRKAIDAEIDASRPVVRHPANLSGRVWRTRRHCSDYRGQSDHA